MASLIVLLAWILPAVVRAETVELVPSRDATLFEDVEGDVASGSGPGLFAGNNSGQNSRRTVIHFLLDRIPAGSTIEAVELRLVVDSAPEPDTVTVSVHRLRASWGEGSSVSQGGQGAAAESGDATWLHRFYPDSLWSAPGGDFDPLPMATAEVGPAGEHSWAAPELVAVVQEWLDSPGVNYGLLLHGEEGTGSTVRRFDSREVTEPTARPRLVVTYAPVGTPVRPTTWGRLKRGRP